MEMTPITRREAFVLAERWQGNKARLEQPVLFAIACTREAQFVGVAVVAEPQYWMLRDNWTVELHIFMPYDDRLTVRLLEEATWKAAHAMGYKRMLEKNGDVMYDAGGRERACPQIAALRNNGQNEHKPVKRSREPEEGYRASKTARRRRKMG